MATVTTVLVTGSRGFVGRNLLQVLSADDTVDVREYESDDSVDDLYSRIAGVDVVVHLAGVNRPKEVSEFDTGNVGLTKLICDRLRETGETPRIILSSSIQAELDNPYGVSKRGAEAELERFAADTGAEVVVFRFKNIFGKWSRPNYNSVVATFCYNVAHDVPLRVDSPEALVDLVYIDVVVEAIVDAVRRPAGGATFRFAPEMDSVSISVGELASLVSSFPDVRRSGRLPDLEEPFSQRMYATYLSYLDSDDLGYALQAHSDERGSLAEFIKSESAGQVFVSRTKPSVTRGNHYHHTKVEKFLVLNGSAVIALRSLLSDELVEFAIEGSQYRVVDIPPGWTHSITNVGNDELVVLFWASEIFDPDDPDTYFCEV